VRGQLQRRLTPTAFERISPNLSAGLGCYVYFYPAIPFRVRDLPGAGFHARRAAVARMDPERIVRRWIGAVARILHLGYLPATMASLGTGNCLREQNAVIDGGFVDVDSIQPISEIFELNFCDDLLQTVLSLTRMIYAFLVKFRGRGQLSMDYGLQLVTQYVEESLRRALVEEARPQLALDPRISRYFAARSSFAELMRMLTEYYPEELPEESALGVLGPEFPTERIRLLLDDKLPVD